jgi:hypothetical protein
MSDVIATMTTGQLVVWLAIIGGVLIGVGKLLEWLLDRKKEGRR